MSVEYTIFDKEGNALMRNKVDEKICKMFDKEVNKEYYSKEFNDLVFISSVSICRNGGFNETTPEAVDKWVKSNMEEIHPYNAQTVSAVLYLLTYHFTVKVR